jgi:hypothetical protein
MANNNGQPNAVDSVTVTPLPRVPEFNASDTEMWFAVVEAYFSKKRVTDEQQQLQPQPQKQQQQQQMQPQQQQEQQPQQLPDIGPSQ